ncbi:MAG: hypothetical protein ABSE77_19425 [Acidimicrobiales bacterium]|jgi:hypothetical protein
MPDNSAALRQARRQDSRAKRQRAADALAVLDKNGELITLCRRRPARRRVGVTSLCRSKAELIHRVGP